MKTKLVKCLICKNWRLKLDGDHCGVCGAAKLHVGNRTMHINLVTNREIVGPLPDYRRLSERQYLQIARVLAD